jgi:hypothetical protein
LLGIIILAGFFRFYQIAAQPGGLFPDEAANGLDIISMQQGKLQPFYERGNGREALFFYMLWANVEAFGKGAWQHHSVSALVGLLAVLGCFFVTKKLFTIPVHQFEPDKQQRDAIWIALLAAFLMAASTWHIALSRTAFRANLIPLSTAWTFYFGLVAVTAKTKLQQYVASCIAGTLFALGFYTYIAYRIMVPIVFILILWPLLVDIFHSPRFQKIKTYFFHALLFLIFFAVFIFPIAHYFQTHPGSFVGRSGQVSVFNPELNHGNLIGTVLEVSRVSIMAYFTEGDLNWRHNPSGYPFVSQVVSPFFAVGLVISLLYAIAYLLRPIKFQSKWRHLVLTGWFWGMLLPVVTTAEGIPHGLRSIGTIPAVFIITAWGMYRTIKYIIRITNNRYLHHSSQTIKPERVERLQKVLVFFTKVLAVCFVITIIAQGYIGQFVYAANSPEYYYSFRADLTPVSNYLNGFDDPRNAIPAGKIPQDFKNRHTKQNTYLILDKFSIQTVDYFTMFDARNLNDPRNNPYTQVDPEDSWKLQGLKPGDEIVFTQSSIFDIKKFKQYHPQAAWETEVRNKFGQAVMAVYTIEK